MQGPPPPPSYIQKSHTGSLSLTPSAPSLICVASRGRSARTWPVWRRPATRWTGSEQTCPPPSCPPSTQPSRPCKSKVGCVSAPCRVHAHLLPETRPQPGAFFCLPGVDGLSLPSRTSEVRLHCPPDTEWGDVAFALAYLRHTKATQGKSPGAHAASSAGGTPSTSWSTATAGGTAGRCTKHMSACPPAPDAHIS
jgi:hypothetical protein